MLYQHYPPRDSLSLGSASSRFSGASARRRCTPLQEGDLITGTVDISHERAYMVSAIRSEAEDQKAEKKALVCTYFSLIDGPV